MAFIPLPSTYEVKLGGLIYGDVPWEANLFYTNETYAPPTQSIANAIMTAVANAYTSSGMLAHLTTAWHLLTVTVTGMDSEFESQFVATNATRAGTNAGEPLPAQTAALIHWKTDLRGRSYRGRTFHGGFTESASSGVGPSAACYTTIQAWAAAITNNFESGSYPATPYSIQTVASRYSGFDLVARSNGTVVKQPKPRVTGVVSPVTAQVVDVFWKTQRRRALAG